MISSLSLYYVPNMICAACMEAKVSASTITYQIKSIEIGRIPAMLPIFEPIEHHVSQASQSAT